MRYNYYFVALFCLVLFLFLTPIKANTNQHVLDFEVNLSQSGSLIQGNHDVTVKIIPARKDANPIHEETFNNMPFIDGNARLPIGNTQPLNPSLFDSSINYLAITVGDDDDDEIITPISVVPIALRSEWSLTSDSSPTGNLFPSISNATDNILIVNNTATGFTYITTENLRSQLNLSSTSYDITSLKDTTVTYNQFNPVTFNHSVTFNYGRSHTIAFQDNSQVVTIGALISSSNYITTSSLSSWNKAVTTANLFGGSPSKDQPILLWNKATEKFEANPTSSLLISASRLHPINNTHVIGAQGMTESKSSTYEDFFCHELGLNSTPPDGINLCFPHSKPGYMLDDGILTFVGLDLDEDNDTHDTIFIGSPFHTEDFEDFFSLVNPNHTGVYTPKKDTIAIFGSSVYVSSIFNIDHTALNFMVTVSRDIKLEADKKIEFHADSIDSSTADINFNTGNISFNTGNQHYFSQTDLSESPYSISFRHAAEDGASLVGAVEISLLNKSISNADNFLGFTTETGETIGSITGQQADVFGIAQSGVKLESSGADYAEYLPKRNPNETIKPGDVIGVYNGKISKSTTNADRVMVVSTMPLVIGNKRPDMDLDTYLAIAFVGQVPVYVSGTVNTGDYIIASGKEDGTAIAVHPDTITASQLSGLIGKAWDSSTNANTNLINVAITPLDIPASLLQSIQTRQDKLEADNQELRKMIETIQQQLSSY